MEHFHHWSAGRESAHGELRVRERPQAIPGSHGGTCGLQPALSLRGLLFSWEAVGRDSDSDLTKWLKKED